jgi:hypothetical protein
MANMATQIAVFNSQNHWLPAGTQTIFPISFAGNAQKTYLDPSHVKAKYVDTVTKAETMITTGVSLVSQFQLQILPAPVAAPNRILVIYRDTPYVAPEVNYIDYGTLDARALNLSALQELFCIQEINDRGTTGISSAGSSGTLFTFTQPPIQQGWPGCNIKYTANRVVPTDNMTAGATQFSPAIPVTNTGNPNAFIAPYTGIYRVHGNLVTTAGIALSLLVSGQEQRVIPSATSTGGNSVTSFYHETLLTAGATVGLVVFSGAPTVTLVGNLGTAGVATMLGFSLVARTA